MLKRRVLLLAAVALAAGALAGDSPADARRGGNQSGIKIGGAKVSPRRLEGTGGTVSVSVRITPRGGPLKIVFARARIIGTDVVGPNATLSGSRTYSGTVTVPANPLPGGAFASIEVFAETEDARRNRSVARIKMGKGAAGGGSQDLPPPPPSNF